jgi:hypothetical protein
VAAAKKRTTKNERRSADKAGMASPEKRCYPGTCKSNCRKDKVYGFSFTKWLLSPSTSHYGLACVRTLSPSVDVRGDRILVHRIDCAPGTDIESATRAIAESIERHIRGFLR